MAELTVVYWRDIPAQVIAKAGRKTAKRQLGDRFQDAIDLVEMGFRAPETARGKNDRRLFLCGDRRGSRSPYCGGGKHQDGEQGAY